VTELLFIGKLMASIAVTIRIKPIQQARKSRALDGVRGKNRNPTALSRAQFQMRVILFSIIFNSLDLTNSIRSVPRAHFQTPNLKSCAGHIFSKPVRSSISPS
jgi:hypothetical protein